MAAFKGPLVSGRRPFSLSNKHLHIRFIHINNSVYAFTELQNDVSSFVSYNDHYPHRGSKPLSIFHYLRHLGLSASVSTRLHLLNTRDGADVETVECGLHFVGHNIDWGCEEMDVTFITVTVVHLFNA